MPARRRPLPPELKWGAFRSADAEAAEVGRGVLRGPGVRRLGHGLFVDAGCEPTYRLMLAAWLMTLSPDESAVDGISALRLWGIEVGSELPYRYVTAARHHSVRQDVRVRRINRLPACTKAVLDPLPALLAARTELDLVGLVIAGDWLVRDGRATTAEVQQALTAAVGRHCRRARRAADLVRMGSESPQETRLRLVLVLAGLPEPECNTDISDERGFIARVDLYLRAWRIAAEYEGDQHRTDPSTYAKDLSRYEQLAAFGVLPIRVAKAHLKRPRDVVRRVYAAMVSRGYDGPPPSFTREWIDAFESPK